MALMNVCAKQVKNYAMQNNYSTKYCFLVDMSLPSGSNRFFVYDLEKARLCMPLLLPMEAAMKRSAHSQNFPMQQIPVAPLLANTRWEKYITVNTANRTDCTDSITVIPPLTKEVLSFMLTIVYLIKKSIRPYCATASAVPWFPVHSLANFRKSLQSQTNPSFYGFIADGNYRFDFRNV